MLWISCSWLLLTTAESPPFVEVMHRPPRRCCRCPAKLRPVKKLIQPSPNQLFPPNLNPDFHMFELQILQTWILKQKKMEPYGPHATIPSVPLKSPPKFPRLEPGAENPGRILHLPRKHHPFRWWPSRSFAVRSLGGSWGISKVLPSKSHKKKPFMNQPTGEFNRNLNFQSKSFKKTYHTTSWNCVFPSRNIPVAKLGEGGKALRVSIPAKANLKALAMRKRYVNPMVDGPRRLAGGWLSQSRRILVALLVTTPFRRTS